MQKPFASKFSMNDDATLQYMESHDVYELVDTLICEVALEQPKEPVHFMAEILLRRIAARHRDRTLSFEDTDSLLVAALPMAMRRRSSAPGNPDREKAAHFGIWFHISYEDLPKIAKQYNNNVVSQEISVPPEYGTNVVFLLQMLATASAIEHYKGFHEAVKLLPLRPDNRIPRAQEELAATVIAFAPESTTSQRRSFLDFMRRVSNHFAVTSASDGTLLREKCIDFQKDQSAWPQFLHIMKRDLRLIDPVMGATDDGFHAFLNGFFNCLRAAPLHDERQVKESLTKMIVDADIGHLPDRAVMYAAVILTGLTQVRTFPLKLVTSLENLVRGSLLDAVNSAALVHHGTGECVRLGDMALLYGIKQFLANDSFREGCGDAQPLEVYLRSSIPNFSDAIAEAFIAVSTEILQLPLPSRDAEAFGMRCYNAAYRCLLRLLVSALQCRTEATLGETLLSVARCYCYGAPPSQLYVHFQFAFNNTHSVSPQQQEMAKQMLTTMQELCLMSLRMPITREISDSLSLLDGLARGKQVVMDHMRSSFPHEYLPTDILANFLEADDMLRRLLRCFSGASEKGVERYYNLCTLIGARLQLCRVHLSPMWEFFSMSMLASINRIAQSSPVHPLLPAMEVLSGMGPAVSMVSLVKSMPHDRRELLTYIQKNKTNRLLMMAVEELLAMFPEYRPRLLRKGFSFERLQQVFMSLLTDILSCITSDLTDIIRPYAVSLASNGMLPHDYDLFGIALTRVMRAPGFPEREWLQVYMDVVDQFLRHTPRVRPLASYTSDEIRKVVRVQACARSWLVRNHRMDDKTFMLNELQRVLTKASPDDDDDDMFSSAIRGDRVTMSHLDRQVLHFSWNAVEKETQAMIMYTAVRQASKQQKAQPASATASVGLSASGRLLKNPMDSVSFPLELSTSSRASESGEVSSISELGGHTASKSTGQSTTSRSRAEARAMLDRCFTIAANFTGIINALYQKEQTQASGDDDEEEWIVLWQELYGEDYNVFFDGLVPPDLVRPTSVHIIEGLCTHVGFSHPGVRAAWVTFMGCLYDQIDKSIKTNM